MNGLKISLFGKFQIQYGEQNLMEIETRKVKELLWYLLLHRDCPHSRELLADLLWSDKPSAQSRKNLRHTLWQLQVHFESQIGSFQSQLFLIEPDWIQMNQNAHNVWIDVAVFEHASKLVQGVLGKELDTQNAQILQDAVNLYRGDLLEDCYQDWCLYERERLQNLYIAMLEKLIDYCEVSNEFELGRSYGERVLRLDPAREGIHRRLMRLLYCSGHRTAALRQYERCRTVLFQELGVEPTSSTVALYHQIRTDQFDNLPATQPMADTTLQVSTSWLTDLLKRLNQAQTSLSNIQDEIKQNIQLVEQVLKNRY